MDGVDILCREQFDDNYYSYLPEASDGRLDDILGNVPFMDSSSLDDDAPFAPFTLNEYATGQIMDTQPFQNQLEQTGRIYIKEELTQESVDEKPNDIITQVNDYSHSGCSTSPLQSIPPLYVVPEQSTGQDSARTNAALPSLIQQPVTSALTTRTNSIHSRQRSLLSHLNLKSACILNNNNYTSKHETGNMSMNSVPDSNCSAIANEIKMDVPDHFSTWDSLKTNKTTHIPSTIKTTVGSKTLLLAPVNNTTASKTCLNQPLIIKEELAQAIVNNSNTMNSLTPENGLSKGIKYLIPVKLIPEQPGVSNPQSLRQQSPAVSMATVNRVATPRPSQQQKVPIYRPTKRSSETPRKKGPTRQEKPPRVSTEKQQQARENQFVCTSCSRVFAFNRVLMRTGGLYVQGKPQYCISCWDHHLEQKASPSELQE